MKTCKIIFSFLLLVILSSCEDSTRTQEVTATDKTFKLTLPTHMKENKSLNLEAKLQYANLRKELYTVVIPDNIADFHKMLKEYNLENDYAADFTGYCKLLLSGLFTNVDLIEKTDLTNLTINGKEAKRMEITAKLNDGNKASIYYVYTFIEGESTYYQVLNWTLQKYKERNREGLIAIADSFAELSGKPENAI